MKLATIDNGRPDGQLVIVTRDLARSVSAGRVAPTLQAALDDWHAVRPGLEALSEALETGAVEGTPFDPLRCLAPLPRAYGRIDAFAYPRGSGEDPFQLSGRVRLEEGRSDRLAAATTPIRVPPDLGGLDIGAQLFVVTGPVPLGAGPVDASTAIRFIGLASTLTAVPAEAMPGLPVPFHARLGGAFAPVLVTPEDFDQHWRDWRLHVPLDIAVNAAPLGRIDTGLDMEFSFLDLVVEAARSRELGPGTILAAGPVSARAVAGGYSGFGSLGERRAHETAQAGTPATPLLEPGDTISIAVRGPLGHSVFGDIEQAVRVLR